MTRPSHNCLKYNIPLPCNHSLALSAQVESSDFKIPMPHGLSGLTRPQFDILLHNVEIVKNCCDREHANISGCVGNKNDGYIVRQFA